MDADLENIPKVSVIMSVYNAERYLKKTIESILAQSFSDFELIIINDGSIDKSEAIIKGFNDPRIRLISRENRGIVYSANQGVNLALGKYVARHDADDLSLPERFTKEVELLDSDPQLGLVGSNYIIIDKDGKKLDETNVFTHPDDLKVAMATCNQYANGSTMMRKKAIIKAGGYKEGRVEDYDLFTRISHDYKIANIKEPLYKWRRAEGSYTFADHGAQINGALAVRNREFKYLLKHRGNFHIFSLHPDDPSYRYRKSLILTNLAYLHRLHGLWFRALVIQTYAVLITPRVGRSRQYLLKVLKPKGWDKDWEYYGI